MSCRISFSRPTNERCAIWGGIMLSPSWRRNPFLALSPYVSTHSGKFLFHTQYAFNSVTSSIVVKTTMGHHQVDNVAGCASSIMRQRRSHLYLCYNLRLFAVFCPFVETFGCVWHVETKTKFTIPMSLLQANNAEWKSRSRCFFVSSGTPFWPVCMVAATVDLWLLARSCINWKCPY